MVDSRLIKHKDDKLTLNEKTIKLFQMIYHEENNEDKINIDAPKIKVSEFVSKMALYYEKIRNSFDYTENHLLQKNAIKRILKRQIIIEGAIKIKEDKSEKISKYLFLELIRAGYLENNKIPEEEIENISFIIEKFIKLRNTTISEINISSHIKKGKFFKANEALKKQNKLSNWFIGLLACEIEEKISKNNIKNTIINNMYSVFKSNILLSKKNTYKNDLNVQLYLSIFKHYMKFDADMLNFVLFKYFNSKWQDANTKDLEIIAKNIDSLKDAINFQLYHPLSKQLNKIAMRYAVFFSILEELIIEDPKKAYENIKDVKIFSKLIEKITNLRYKKIKKQLVKSAIKSIIYILLTKSIFVILLEAPAIKFLGEIPDLSSLIINITFPGLILLFVAISTKIPEIGNTKKIIKGVCEITFKERKKDPFILKEPEIRNKFMNLSFGLIYFFTYFISFGIIINLLNKINFHWISTVIFLFFLAFVSFFSIKIKKDVKEITVLDSKDTIFKFIINFLFVPIVVVGKYLSDSFSKFSPFVFVFDIIIEPPFKAFVHLIEEWNKYMKEKKAEVD